MAATSVSGIAIRGIASAVPTATKGVKELAELVGADAENVAQLTGVKNRHVVRPDQTSSDLCFAAAERLLASVSWERESVDVLIFISETFDYILPPTACVLQTRLGLSTGCAAFDVNLGCSGYIYGLWMASSFILAGAKRVLLLCGETTTRIVSPQDRAAYPLFGDAGTATAIEKGDGSAIHFDLNTDGRGYDHLIIPAGGFRTPRTNETFVRTQREPGCLRSEEDVHMNGPEIFTFTLREVPSLVSRILGRAGWTKEDTDLFVMHQANRFMLYHLAKKMGIPYTKVPIALDEFGNTSSASIPLCITHCVRKSLAEKKLRLVLAGFGVGLSWGAAALELGPVDLPELVIVP